MPSSGLGSGDMSSHWVSIVEVWGGLWGGSGSVVGLWANSAHGQLCFDDTGLWMGATVSLNGPKVSGCPR